MNGKLDTSLSLALDLTPKERQGTELSAGYNPVTNQQEIIVKFSGDIAQIAKEFDAKVDRLNGNLAVLTIDQNRINALADRIEIEYIEMPKFLGLNVSAGKSVSCITVTAQTENLSGKGVIVGIIDSGIDYRHPEFLTKEGKTRILSIWDQALDKIFTEQDINAALSLSREESIDLLPHQDLIGHGTHVAGIAAGNGGVAPGSSIVAVKLAGRGSASYGNTVDIMLAVKYVIDFAQERKMPIAINISFGTNNGSHDNQSLFEEYLDDSALRWKNSIVIPTGNEGSDNHHYFNQLMQDQILDIEFTVAAGLPSVYLTLWKDYIDIFDVELIAPNGSSTGRVKYVPNGSLPKREFILDNTQVFIYFGEPTPYNASTEIYIELKPFTMTTEGVWKLRLYGTSIVLGFFDIWLPITEAVTKKTAFTEPTPDVTLTVPSTAMGVISVGGYDPARNSAADFSGRGFSRRFNYVKPDLVAPATNITSASVGGGYTPQSGTSMAAPFVTGSCALLMEWGITNGNNPYLYGELMKAVLHYGAKREPNITYPSTIWGYGRLCLKNSLDFLKKGGRISSMQNQINSMQEIETPQESQAPPSPIPPAISEDYDDYIIATDPFTDDYLSHLDYVAVCPTDDPNVSIIHVRKDKTLNFLTKQFIFERPILLGLMDPRTAEASGISAVQNFSILGLMGDRVVVAIIDTGIDYTIPDFVYPDGTSKIIYIWDQTADYNGDENLCYGREYTREEINQALASEEPLSIVPETDEIGHGTFLAGLVAGLGSANDDYKGLAPQSELIIVKLKPAKQNTKEYYRMYKDVPCYQSNDIIQAIKYVVKKIGTLFLPVSICIGMGSNFSPHDGSSLFSNYLDRTAFKRGFCISCCAGNEGSAKHHFKGVLASSITQGIIEFKSGEKEKGFTLLIWTSIAEALSYSLTSPTGERLEKISPKVFDFRELRLTLESTVVSFVSILAYTRNGSQLTFIKFKDPTPGIWQLEINAEKVVRGQYDAWLPVSAFLEPDTYFLAPTPDVTITSPGDSAGLIVYGAYDSTTSSIYIQSGRGPTRNGYTCPTLTAPGVNVTGPSRGGGYISMTGTSVSAAVGTAAGALMLEWGVVKQNDFNMNTLKIKSYLIRGARRRPDVEYPSVQWGFGELDLFEAFRQLKL